MPASNELRVRVDLSKKIMNSVLCRRCNVGTPLLNSFFN